MITPLHRSLLKAGHKSITYGAIAFVIAVCISLLIMDGWRSLNARNFELQEMSAETSNLAQAMAQHANDSFKAADSITYTMVERVETYGSGPAELQRLHSFLAISVTQMPQLNALAVYDEHGRWLADSHATLLQIFNNSDREYFVYHRTHTDRGPHIGSPLISRATGRWVIPISRRINDAQGNFSGVALATIDIDYFRQFYGKLNIGQAGSLVLALDDGTMLLRRPYNDALVGSSMLNTQLFQAFRSRGRLGTLFITSRQDGITRLISYRGLYDYPLFVAIGFSKEEILADWWRDTLLHSSGAIILVIILALAGIRLVRQINLRVKTEEELLRARDALETLNQTLEKLATQDGLTGLANRRKFDTSLAEEFSRATREASALALVMIDVDLFKKYNDIYGHPAGDECLRAISQTIKNLLQSRPENLAARYGGEELSILLPHTDVAGAVAVAEKIRQTIEHLRIRHPANPQGVVTVSAGVEAFAPGRNSDSAGQLVEAADKALYAAKSAGRNRVCTSDETSLQLGLLKPDLAGSAEAT